MKKITILLISCSCFLGFAQNIMSTTDKYPAIPQEKVFLHYNASFLLSGEKLLYKVYCLNSETNKLSKLSKIAYVELIDSKHTVHFKHKIKLKEGIGQGDFFIPASIGSGNYKILAYTKWMQNGGKTNFFHGDVTILNPFSDNSGILISKQDSIATNGAKVTNDINDRLRGDKSEYISLDLPKDKFESREKVVLALNSSNEKTINGQYSISVQKVDSIPRLAKFTSKTYEALFKNQDSPKQHTITTMEMPEFRGEIIAGKVFYGESNKVAPNTTVSLSIPGKDYVFKVSSTDSNGVFYFTIAKEYSAFNATIQIVNNNPENFKIVLNDTSSIHYENLIFEPLELSQDTKKMIVERSIDNQVENAYALLKQDSLVVNDKHAPFYGTEDTYEYLLDDFTRFPTLKETITEITGHIYYSKKGDQYSINILGLDYLFRENSPLILVDGIQVLDANEIIDLNTEKVKKITVLKQNYVYGIKYFSGVIAIETFDGGYQNLKNEAYRMNIELFKPLTSKQYFNQTYHGDVANRIPDFRHQLFWEPNVVLANKNTAVTFYTSDVKGIFEINLEGFTSDGEPISTKTYFTVE